MKHLQLTQSTNPSNPLDGSPYVFYNPNINKVWIYLGLNWILEDGSWNMDYQWANNGRWNMFTTFNPIQPIVPPIIEVPKNAISGYDLDGYTKEYLENPEYKNVVLDADNRVLYGEYVDGNEYKPDLSGYYDEQGAPISLIVNHIVAKEF